MRLGTVLLVALAVFLGWFALSGLFGTATQSNMRDIQNQVADNQVAQYNMAVQHGTSMEVCVHAGIVVAAYLQAGDEGEYVKWEHVQYEDCKYATADAENDLGKMSQICKTVDHPSKYSWCRSHGLSK